jgi:hypothetical protein
MSRIALMIKTARSSETLANFHQTTRRYNPEDSHLHDKPWWQVTHITQFITIMEHRNEYSQI